ncbi:MAG: IS66 family transposase [Acidobacteria bacterium]|jgi:transposase|nr:IS66 family transposase [Acidobacteriota bacterium]
MKAADIPRIDLDVNELLTCLDLARPVLGEDRYGKLKAALEMLHYLTDLIGNKKTTIHRLQQIIFGARTEKIQNVFDNQPGEADASSQTHAAQEKGCTEKGKAKEKPKGHGRNGARDYTGAQRIKISHESLKSGDPCPLCGKGKVYAQKTPAYIVRLFGRTPIGATVHEMERLRCNLCLEVFTAAPPEGVGTKKYDETAGAMIPILRYGSGFPFHRLQRLQASVGIPLPASTQWGIVLEIFKIIHPVFKELMRQAAQGKVLYNDDTTMRILALMGKRAEQKRIPESDDSSARKSDRTGVFTSGIVSTREGREIVLFFTGRKYAGENLADVLKQRESEAGTPIQMCDGLLSRNVPREFEVILSNCTAHARRGFVEVASRFPDECRHVLETLRDVYMNEAVTKKQGMSAEERMAFHKAHSGPLMEALEKWLDEQINEKKVEPNSGLGQAIFYMKNHWTELVQFLHVPGAPLDNTICERALKKAILHRKGSLFYKTQNGAQVGDLFMSLIYTCERCRADPFDYLVELQKHAAELAENPEAWMPWNYRETIERGRASPCSN